MKEFCSTKVGHEGSESNASATNSISSNILGEGYSGLLAGPCVEARKGRPVAPGRMRSTAQCGGVSSGGSGVANPVSDSDDDVDCISSVNPLVWTCNTCTFANNKNGDSAESESPQVCEMCNTRRYPADDVGSEAEDGSLGNNDLASIDAARTFLLCMNSLLFFDMLEYNLLQDTTPVT
eukprot:CAMPEP_0114473634 /NCGR_PEP_ID=MMETSP0104-20121206/13088_1 /TAXON_ID=37642 ORGANISM="Paraphysomonas imperforata, Strain PA2" /NCGR_SAMPLE_ID=MMETSP0104 /ASSEMBLY_ACC=CAM_ASM_000202 /LENGTH=178 /DNA_ID=CAMNT_0001647835 /DNA_START=337 /DNA_END=873 /DNA_ORIENTATION=-